MRYIFCNYLFKNAVKEIPLKSAKKEWENKYNSYEIWSISEEDFIKIDESYLDEYYATDKDLVWKENWGWWRWCNGSNIETQPTHMFTINSKQVLLYYAPDDIRDFADLVLDDYSESYDEDRWPFDGPITKEIEEQYFKEYGNFENIFKYCLEIWRCSNETNVSAIITANAKLNNMKVHEFLKFLD